MTTRRRHVRGRAGYSLVEVMVAMTAGAILLSGTYILTKHSNESFFLASRLATSQAAVRLASEQLRADVARAGFLAHPDTNPSDPGMRYVCGEPQANGITTWDTAAANTLRAVELDANLVTSGDQDVRHDTLTMTGNYATNERYKLTTAIDFGTMRLDPNDPAFQRSFVDVSGTTFNEAAFDDAFRPGRLVRVENYSPTRRDFFRIITARSANAGAISGGTGPADPLVWASGSEPTVSFAALPGGSCSPSLNTGNMKDGFIAPLSTIVYQVVAPGDLNLANLALDNADGGSMEWLLVRREWDYAAADFVPGSERVVLPYLLEFRLAGLQCAGALGTRCAVPDLVVDTALGAAPHELRGLRISLAARTPEVDPAFDPNGAFLRASPLAGPPLRSWRPAGALGTGRARVRSANFDAALMNSQPR